MSTAVALFEEMIQIGAQLGGRGGKRETAYAPRDFCDDRVTCLTKEKNVPQHQCPMFQTILLMCYPSASGKAHARGPQSGAYTYVWSRALQGVKGEKESCAINKWWYSQTSCDRTL